MHLGLGFLHSSVCARRIPMTLRGRQGQTPTPPMGAPLSSNRHVGLPRLLCQIHQLQCYSDTQTHVSLRSAPTPLTMSWNSIKYDLITLVCTLYINVRFFLLPIFDTSLEFSRETCGQDSVPGRHWGAANPVLWVEQDSAPQPAGSASLASCHFQ